MIDVRSYDMAIVNRIKSYFNNTHWIQRPNLPIKEIRDRKIINGEDIEFPIITIRRTNCPFLSKEYNSWSRSKTGQPFTTNPNRLGNINLFNADEELANKIVASGHNDAVSVVNTTFDLTYYIDVIALERDNFDTIVVELQENLIRNPYISFYNLKPDGTIDRLIKDQSCHLLFEEIEDTSDLENFDAGNALFRATITVKINAYIYRKYRELAVEMFDTSYDIHDSSMHKSCDVNTSIIDKSTFES